MGGRAIPRCSGFRLRLKPTGARPGGVGAGSSRLEEIGPGAVALLLADLARLGYRQPEMPPRPPPNKINRLRSGPLTAPPRPRKGESKGKVGGAKGVLRRSPEEANPEVETNGGFVSGAGHGNGPPPCTSKRPGTGRTFPRNHRLPHRPARYPLVGRYFVAGLAFSLRWWEFSINPYMGLPTGVATAGANAFVMATII